MNKNIKTLLISIAIPIAAGLISSLLTIKGMSTANLIVKPPLSPPGWIFPIVWTILYALMGYASFLIYTSDKHTQEIENALKYYIAQLIVNFFWSLVFFNLRWFFTALIGAILLWVLILFTIISFFKIEKKAAYLLIPYIVWVTFAIYLTGGITLLN